MGYHKIRWSFIDPKTAVKAINLFGARSLDRINFYINNKKIDYSHYHNFTSIVADKKAKKEIRKFFKQNLGVNDFVEFIKN